ncbi:Ca2+-binding RTX toxin-like protein [Pseudoduganella flava]|nr:calcium-binding protein [Pseudoduganella flava]TWI44312.1 Ca2+-binding RTX toxin-like protein [Pseudoduganella flava]
MARIAGTADNDTLVGTDGNDVLLGFKGNDALDGAAGTRDIASYGYADGAVAVNLATGQATGADGTDSLAGIEGVFGSYFADTITGDANANVLDGLAGNDTLRGGGGDDTIVGGSGVDVAVYSGARTDYEIKSDAAGKLTIRDLRAGSPDGTDIVWDVRKLTFLGGAKAETIELKAVDHVVAANPASYQLYQSVATLLDGSYVAAWRAPDANGDGIYLRKFDADGVPAGSDVLVNADQVGDQRAVVVTGLYDGGWVAVYHSNPFVWQGYESDWDVRLQRFDAAGAKVGDEVLVNSVTAGDQRLPVVTATSDNGFVVAWQSRSGATLDIKAQKFDADNNKAGGEFTVNAATDGDQVAPAVAELQDGYVVAWYNAATNAVMTQAFGLDGGTAGSESAVAVAPDGGKIGAVKVASLYAPYAAAIPAYVVTWIQDAKDGTDTVHARIYNADGSVRSADITVAGNGDQIGHSVVGLRDGSFMVVWDEVAADDTSVIMGRHYNADGSAAGAAFQVNQSSALGVALAPTVIETADQRVVVSWGTQGSAYPGSGGIYQQIVDYNGNPEFVTAPGSTAPGATTIAVKSVIGGAMPMLDPAYNGMQYWGLTDVQSAAKVTNGHLMVTGAAAFGSTVTLYDGATKLATVGVDDNGSWAVELDQLAAGTHSFTAVVADANGNKSAASKAFALTIDGVLKGTGGADSEAWFMSLGANGAAQTLDGGAGNDTLNGNGGKDTLIGGAGDDTYLVNNAGVTIVEAAGGGTDTVTATVATTLAANVENLTFTGGAGYVGTGNALNNSIMGSSGNDKLDGGAGNDTLHGGMGGADTLIGGAGDDTYIVVDGGETITEAAGAGTDTVYAVMQDMTLAANVENLFLSSLNGQRGTGNAANNQITGDQFNDTLSGEAGNDTLDGGGGSDTLVGGTGNDTYYVDAGDTVVEQAAGGIDTIVARADYTLGAELENLQFVAGPQGYVGVGNALNNVIGGGVGGDVLDGAAGNDTLAGNAGDDTLDGGAGIDSMTGGAGDDLYVVDNAGDKVIEAAGGGTDMVQTSLASYTLGTDVEFLSYSGEGAFSGTGNGADNFMRAVQSTGARLAGLAGDDTLFGGAGADSLSGGDGADRIGGMGGMDTIDGGAGNDTAGFEDILDNYKVVRSGENAVTLTHRVTDVAVTVRDVETFEFGKEVVSFADLVATNVASAWGDQLFGTDAGEALDGLAGADTMTGGAGDDTYTVDSKGDVIVELDGGGTDKVRIDIAQAGYTYTLGATLENADVVAKVAVNVNGNGANNAITGNALANVLAGLDGNDTLSGGAGNDKLDGGAGADLLDGGAGSDTLAGGAGNDEYVVDAAGDQVVEADGGGSDIVRATGLTTWTLGKNVEMLVFDAAGKAVTGTGNADGNALSGGTAASAKLFGLGGADMLTGTAGADSLVGGDGNDTLAGRAGADTLDGGAGTDTARFNGDLADYTIERIGEGDVRITGTAATTVRGVESFAFADRELTFVELANLANKASAWSDSLTGGSGADALDGLAGADTLVGYEGTDTYTVDSKDDVIVEAVDGGYDTVQVALTVANATYTLAANVEAAKVTAKVAANVTGNGEANTLTGNDLANVLTGLDGDDTLSGGGGNDRLEGGAGNDKLVGGAGNDTLAGGAGDDEYRVDASGDVIIEAGDGHDFVYASVASYTLAANVEDLVAYNLQTGFTGNGNASNNLIVGTQYADKLSGNDGNDTLVGDAGYDTLSGGAGDDTAILDGGNKVFDGGTGGDVAVVAGSELRYAVFGASATDTLLTDLLTGSVITLRNVEAVRFAEADVLVAVNELRLQAPSTGNDNLQGSENPDTIDGGAGNDTIAGAEGNDSLQGGAGTDSLVGGTGNDTLDGGAGKDVLAGGAGDDVYIVDTAGEVHEGDGDGGVDAVKTALASYVLDKNVEMLFYTGTAAFSGTGNEQDNLLFGGSGADRLAGGAGNDVLVGGSGADTLTGGDGSDAFVIDKGDKPDTVADFKSGTDVIVFDAPVLAIGNRDSTVDGATLAAGKGDFAASAELVIVTTNAKTLDTAGAAAVIGSAQSAYDVGAMRLFVVDNGLSSAVFKFSAAAADAQVSAGELTLLATLTGVPATAVGDFVFGTAG